MSDKLAGRIHEEHKIYPGVLLFKDPVFQI